MLIDFGKIIEDAQEETDEALNNAVLPDDAFDIPEPELPPRSVNDPDTTEKGE